MTIYCSRCGAKNEDTAQVCTQCGQPLYARVVGRTRREEEMCFGLPHHWGVMIFGIFILIVGVLYLFSRQLKLEIDIWPLILIFVGIIIIAGALYRSSRGM
jgi:predicted RND superfamily exporter protein